MAEIVAAPPGWYYVRIEGDGNGHLRRYPVAGWTVTGNRSRPLLAKPGEPGLVEPTAEDEACLVGLCPPDREYVSYFTSEDIQEALKRDYVARHPEHARARREATVREVEVPGVGKVPVRDARPPGQTGGGTSEWMRRAWGGQGGPQPRLGAGGGGAGGEGPGDGR